MQPHRLRSVELHAQHPLNHKIATPMSAQFIVKGLGVLGALVPKCAEVVRKQEITQRPLPQHTVANNALCRLQRAHATHRLAQLTVLAPGVVGALVPKNVVVAHRQGR